MRNTVSSRSFMALSCRAAAGVARATNRSEGFQKDLTTLPRRENKIASIFGLLVIIILSGCAALPLVSFTPFSDGEQSILMDDFSYRILDTDQTITVHAGFVTDFASTPRALWAVLPPFGTYQRAAVIHDYLYWDQSCSIDQADKILMIAMYESNVDKIKREIIYRAVRRYGKKAWDNNKKEREIGLPRFIPIEYLPSPSQILSDTIEHDDKLYIDSNDTWDKYRIRLAKANRTPKFEPLSSNPSGPPSYCNVPDHIWERIKK